MNSPIPNIPHEDILFVDTRTMESSDICDDFQAFMQTYAFNPEDRKYFIIKGFDDLSRDAVAFITDFLEKTNVAVLLKV